MKLSLTAFTAALFFCGTFGAISAGTLPDISGTWYSGGDHSKRCYIEQSGTSVTLRNEDGQRATGRFVDPSTLETNWGYARVRGAISTDLQTIRWSNSTFWTRAGSESPRATPSPNPYREIRLASPTLENRSQGKIAILGGWAAVKRDGHGAVICVSFKNEATLAATRVVFQFSIFGRSDAALDELEFDRTGTFSPGIDIRGWDSLSSWQSGMGHHGYNENCKVINSSVAALSLLSARSITYKVTRVEYADGNSWTP